MGAFVSYARLNAPAVVDLHRDLEELLGPVWMDSRLGGGAEWWDSILEAIRGCDLFVLALSAASLDSAACMSEVSYAIALQRPILPVLVEECDLRALPPLLQRLHVVKYLDSSSDGVRNLAKALLSRKEAPPLPSPLPVEPAMPASYGEEYRLRLAVRMMTMDEQVALAAVLRAQGHDPIHGDDARSLLVQLRARPDIVLTVASEIDDYLETGAASSVVVPPAHLNKLQQGLVETPDRTITHGVLRVHRKNAWSARAVKFRVEVNGREVAALRADQNVEVDLIAGEHWVEIVPNGVLGLQYPRQRLLVEVHPGRQTVVVFSNNRVESVAQK